LTGYATPDHVAHFRNDVYDLDSGADTTASIPTPRQQAPVATIAASPSKPSAAPAPTPKAPVAKSFVERDARPIPQAE
jgi:hypothetical protein